MSALQKVRNLEDAAREIDRLERRIKELEDNTILFIGDKPVSEGKLNGKKAVWYDYSDGQLKMYDGKKIVTWSED